MKIKSVEAGLLEATHGRIGSILTSAALSPTDTAARLSLLEVTASVFAGWNVAEYWALTGYSCQQGVPTERDAAESILAEIRKSGLPVPLALAALSREELGDDQQRRTGAYYTDWRLAQLLAESGTALADSEGVWIDTACGTGTLLVAAALAVPEGEEREHILRKCITGADLSAVALRGAALALAGLTRNLDTVADLRGRLLHQDSLRSRDAWRAVVGEGASLVIGNPPWEQLRPSRHESARSAGVKRYYGATHDVDIDMARDRRRILDYVKSVTNGTSFQGRGGHDYYKLFLELGLGLTKEGGVLALLLPAGLVRSKGAEFLRRELLGVSTELSVSVIENRARHFAIDTRFKFLAVTARLASGKAKPIELRVADRSGLLPDAAVSIDRDELASLRADLSIPEVRTNPEWDLYRRLASNATLVGDVEGPWHPEYKREVDMTLDRHLFRARPGGDAVPLLEGRHVSQFRWRSKRYVSGEGRAAIWEPQELGNNTLSPQWWVSPQDLSPASARRAGRSRIGFCDITGQTNERSLLVARLPSGVACGNKVPTVVFAEGGRDREDLFLGLANSLVVDWMLRRMVTTTVNFFILDSLPLPKITETSPTGRELIASTRKVSAAEGTAGVARLEVGKLRARLDALVAIAWGLSLEDMRLVLRDFPLLDRGQPPLPGEAESTITADAVLAEMARLYGINPGVESGRAVMGFEAGATPYVPAEYVTEGRLWRASSL